MEQSCKISCRNDSKKIETFQIDDWPASLKNCTIEQLTALLKEAHRQGRLNF